MTVLGSLVDFLGLWIAIGVGSVLVVSFVEDSTPEPGTALLAVLIWPLLLDTWLRDRRNRP